VSAEQVYRAYNAAENDHDVARAASLVAPDLVVEVNGRPALASAEEDARATAELMSCYPDYHREIIEILSTGSRAAVRWRMSGTPVADVADTLGVLDLHGCSVIEVIDDRIASASLYFDRGVLDALLNRVEPTP
jgi:predicted ester cyclase